MKQKYLKQLGLLAFFLTVVGGVLTGCGGASAQGVSVQPQAGYYLWTGYVTSVTPACVGNSVGSTYVGTEYYPGPNKSGHIIHTPLNGNGYVGDIATIYPTTPSAGVLSWLGTVVSSTQVINGVSSDNAYTFVVNYTFIDDASFVTIATQTYANGCSFTIQLSHVLTGH